MIELDRDNSLSAAFWFILGFAVLLRLILFFVLADPVEPDSEQYLKLANNFFAAYVGNESRFLDLTLNRPPGYPLFLAALSWIGRSVVLLVQVLMNLSVVLMVFVVGRELFDERAGLLGMFLIGIDPVTMIFTLKFLSETLFTTLLLTSFWLINELDRVGFYRTAVLGGFLLGFSVLVRPISFYLPLVLAPVLPYTNGIPWKKGILWCLVFLLSFVLLPGGWMVRNYYATGEPMISNKQGDNLLNYRAAGAVADSRGISFEEARRIVEEAYRESLDSNDSLGTRNRIKKRLGVKFILNHPLGYLISASRGAVRIMLGPGRASALELLGFDSPTKVWSSPTRMSILLAEVLILLFIYLVTLFGTLWLFVRTRWHELIPLGTIVLYLLVLSAGPEAYSRFRVPMVPFIALLAAPAIYWIRSGGTVASGSG